MSGQSSFNTAYFRNSLARVIVTVFAVSFLTFLLTSLLPGDPVFVILGIDNATTEDIERVRGELGLDDPFATRYFKWLGDAVTGDLGESATIKRPVADLIKNRLPVTLELVVLSVAISLAVSIPLGIYTAHKPNSLFSKITSLWTYVMLSIPSFVVGIVMILFFAIEWDWLPASGWTKISEDLYGNLKQAIMPAMALALPQIAVFSRLLRGDMLTTLDQDFVSFADSKGLSTRRILLGHAFRTSSFSLLTLTGTSIGYLMGGTVIIEQMFNLPGMGSMMVTAIISRDYFLVQGITLFVATAFVLINFIVDMLYAVLDPRIRRGHGTAAV